MNKNILNTGVQQFITEKLDADIMSVLLKKPPFSEVTAQELAQQIESKKKCQKKLPTWFNTPNIYYPKKIHIEQTSSEITAQYKAEIVTGKSLIDLTGGLGIDSYFFAKKIATILHCETNTNLAEIAAHNFKILNVKNIQNHSLDAIDFLQQTTQNFDWIYIDPSRRNDTKGKVFLLSDCTPDITEHLTLFFEKSDNILIKTAPLLDISAGLAELKNVKEIHIVAVHNEVKELLWVLKKGYKNEVVIKTINHGKAANQTFNFNLSEEKRALSTFQEPQTYLYEPNAAILKSGGFRTIGQQHALHKLHEHTHLYTSEKLIAFPGRRFKIDKTVPYNKKSLKELQVRNANISTRNFPESVASIRKKFKIKDGGDIFLFFVKNCFNKHQILVCSKV